MKSFSSILILLVAGWLSAGAEDFSGSDKVYFHQSRSKVDMRYRSNDATVDSLISDLRTMTASDSLFHLNSLRLIGAASPEGTVTFNDYLSHRRADALLKYISGRVDLPIGVSVSTDGIGRDWIGLYRLVEADSNVPAREETLSYIASVIDTLATGRQDTAASLAGLKHIGDGEPYAYMYQNLFPSLREASLTVDYSFLPYDRIIQPSLPINLLEESFTSPSGDLTAAYLPVRRHHNFYMALKTNMLYDVLALPSLSAEFYLGKNFSVVGNWTYGWWDNDRRHRYWRAYGGDLAFRWWFGAKAAEKPLTGHHVGVYGGAFTYDFEFGGLGHMGGRPGHSLWDKCLLNCGLEYGYSLPVGRRLNIDFTIGIGYAAGQYYKYIPCDGEYLWQSTHSLHWFGPTKAEVSLVWLIGRGNVNTAKGGKI